MLETQSLGSVVLSFSFVNVACVGYTRLTGNWGYAVVFALRHIQLDVQGYWLRMVGCFFSKCI